MRAIHVHLPARRTHDSGGWDESKHDRKDNGQFGHGKGDSRPAPKEGDVGHEEHTKYGAYHRKGDHVTDRTGKSHQVISHQGPEVVTTGGSFHPTKLTHVKPGEIEKDAQRDADAQKSTGAVKMTKLQAKAAAAIEYVKAGQGKGSYAKAAELYDAAGMKDKADGARALAKRYGHDKDGQSAKSKADLEDAKKSREHAKAASSDEVRKLYEARADLYEQRSKDPESNELSKKIDWINQRLSAPGMK